MAEQVSFSDGWTEQTFSLFSSNDFEIEGSTLNISSDGTVSILWKSLPSSMWETNQASWNWAVKATVPPTDLTLKGGDDRNISIYFLFLLQRSIPKKPLKLTDLLRNKDARVLMYVWGGNHNPGEILPSPYLRDDNCFSNMIVTSPRGTPSLDIYALFNIRSSDNSHI